MVDVCFDFFCLLTSGPTEIDAKLDPEQICLGGHGWSIHSSWERFGQLVNEPIGLRSSPFL